VSAPEKLRELLRAPDFLVMPAVWDGLSARLAQQAGFKTAFLSGSCVAATRLGGPDLDLLSFTEMRDSFEMAHAAAPELLLLADADHGYGNAMNVQRTVRAYGRAGAAAILIEDKITPRALTSVGKPCLSRDEARMKMRAAIQAARESGILVLARTDCRPTQGLDEALARVAAFVEEGADILFMDSPVDEAEFRRAVEAAQGRPCFAVLSSAGTQEAPTAARAAQLGLRIGTFPTAMLSPAIGGMLAGLAAMAAGDAEVPGALAPSSLRTLLGYEAYDTAAAPFRVGDHA
jgi:2-methylisocitrate lyase-like PEP mutase family enzyme